MTAWNAEGTWLKYRLLYYDIPIDNMTESTVKKTVLVPCNKLGSNKGQPVLKQIF